MKKRAGNILTALLVCCCSLAHVVLAGTLRVAAVSEQAVPTGNPGHPVVMSSAQGTWQAVGAWIRDAAQTVGTTASDAWATVREFFTSGKALAVVQSVAQSINDTAVRLFLPFAQLLVPVLARMGLSATPELVAVWTFWIVVVLLLIILLLALRPRRAAPRKLPRVTSRTADQGQNAIEFGVVEQGPAPTAMPEQLEPAKREHAAAPVQEHAAGPAEETPHGPSVPEISLEPLGFFTGSHVGAPQPAAEAETPAMATSEPAPTELISPIVPPQEPAEVVPEIEVPPVQEAQELPPQEVLQPAPEPELRPMGQEAPEAPEVPAEPAEIPLLEQTQPSATPEPAAQAETTMAEPAAAPETPPVEVSSAEIPSVKIPPVEVPAPSVEPPASETPAAPATHAVPVQPAAPSGADLLSRLLEAEESFDQTVASPPVAPRPVPTAPAEPAATEPQQEGSMFGGDVDLDTLLRDGVVADAAALTQLFKGGYRSQISKLAVSAKDLQNVPTDVRNVMKLTVVALSPIELSIARDLAMRLEAPGFVGEALLVARKMGYENYLTTYRNISRNYKDVNIVETSSLKVPAAFHQPEDLISFS